VGGKAVATLPLRVALVAPGAPVAQAGDAVDADYVGRLANGTMFDTSVQALAQAPFPHDPIQHPFQPLSVSLTAEAQVIPGFLDGLLGMAEGQSKTIVLSPDQAYGNATRLDEVPRTSDVQRLSQPFPRVQHFPRGVLGNRLNASSQVGDTLFLQDPTGNTRTYTITALDQTNVTLLWDVRVGDTFTLTPLWPNQSHAVNVTNDTVVYRTDPLDTNATLTYYSFWPNMSRIAGMNDTTIVVQHSPPVGLNFSVPRGGPAQVLALNDTAIQVLSTNPNPLAGQTLYFDITLRSLQKGAGTANGSGD
jgi:FKBP-type peptidyl-prolyl cis-trans isomerase 2